MKRIHRIVQRVDGRLRLLLLAGAASLAVGASPAPDYDVVIRGGTLYDGSGSPGVVGDLAVKRDRIVAMGHVSGHGAREIDAAWARRRARLHQHAELGQRPR